MNRISPPRPSPPAFTANAAGRTQQEEFCRVAERAGVGPTSSDFASSRLTAMLDVSKQQISMRVFSNYAVSSGNLRVFATTRGAISSS
jgi:hypothetical protein